MKTSQNRFRGCLLGLAVGDAVGTTVEFKRRGSFPLVTEMLGGGPFDQMDRYWDWYQNGYLSSTGRYFDIGNTVREALETYKRTGDPFSGSTDPHTAGNGSLMRLAPIAMFYFPDLEKMIQYAVESSRTTHGALECTDACRLFAEMLFRALCGLSKDEIVLNITANLSSPKLRKIAAGSYLRKSIDQIHGTGYVVDSLEAALWCFSKTDTFESAILQATNLGDDADTTAAICGQIAGTFYGESGIPAKWLQKLYMRAEITDFADKLSGERTDRG